MLQVQPTLTIGDIIRTLGGDRYVIEGLLGKGGFGAVYLVRDRRVKQRRLALKEVFDANKRDRERFILEGEILKRLDHPAMPRVHQVFELDNPSRVYMLMDYIKGSDLETLRENQPEQRFSLPSILVLMAPIVDALIYLHHQNPPIVHRDIKPENIIVPVGTDEAVLVDFGSAKEYTVDRTTTAFRHGSPGYAALEQYGSGTTPRTDIYGLGATLYTLLTGSIPPDAITRATRSQGFDPLEPAHLIAPDVPWPVAMAIERAMSISSEDRFATIEEFWQELTAHEPQQQLHTTRNTSPDTPLPLTVSEQALAPLTITSASLQRLPHLLHSRKHVTIFLAVVLTVLIGASILFYASPYGGPLSVFQRGTRLFAPSTPQSRMTPAAISPTSTLASGVPIYSNLTATYAGTVMDLLAKEKTNMFLTRIQQNQGSIHGYFQGLGFVSPFKGSITPSGHIQFTVIVQGGKSTLAFDGDIKIGGDIVGSFEVLDQHGQPTGESGLWNIASSA